MERVIHHLVRRVQVDTIVIVIHRPQGICHIEERYYGITSAFTE